MIWLSGGNPGFFVFRVDISIFCLYLLPMNNALRDSLNKVRWQSEEAYIKYEYDKAYYRFVFCPENERSEAQRLLQIWRSKWFAH